MRNAVQRRQITNVNNVQNTEGSANWAFQAPVQTCKCKYCNEANNLKIN